MQALKKTERNEENKDPLRWKKFEAWGFERFVWHRIAFSIKAQKRWRPAHAYKSFFLFKKSSLICRSSLFWVFPCQVNKSNMCHGACRVMPLPSFSREIDGLLSTASQGRTQCLRIYSWTLGDYTDPFAWINLLQFSFSTLCFCFFITPIKSKMAASSVFKETANGTVSLCSLLTIKNDELRRWCNQLCQF